MNENKFHEYTKNERYLFHRILNQDIICDQMILYATLRKGQQELRSHKLKCIDNAEFTWR